ncbi:MAG TPA: SpoIIE family protein phosphatase, partial [Bacteroidia bacterium]|nr:SpoIIE family protein phosphatase [Bacteroidia bacterium]
DCTGHGVPGALMSMIGFNFLGQIVNEMHIRKTSAILDELHRKILFALNRNLASGDVKDGMDIALLRIFKGSRKIEFSGAVRPLYIVNAGKLNIIDGDIYSIGGIKDPEKESFSCHEMEVESGSMLYLFSDGYADQFGMSSEERGKVSAKTGTPAGKKFKYRRLRELLSAVSGKPADEQQRLISETFLAWKGNLEQVDDILVIGIRPD